MADSLRDRYRIERELGRGGMATVYLARDLRHDRLVALKVLRPELATALGPERFLREVRIAAGLQHPNILTVFDSGTADPESGEGGSAGGAQRLWFTMPYVQGESLRQRLTREPQLPLEDAIGIAVGIADALGHAHRHGVIHRDVKPENILLSDDRCVLADFGVARAIEAAGGERLTETGFALGTPAYMSPEQGAGDGRLDGRSDLYSLGCVLYEMLAGEPPFTGRTAQAIVARRMTDPVPPLRTIRDIPEPVERVVAKALARSPADRFADAAAFAEALKAAAANGAIQEGRGGRRRRVIAVVAGLAVLALGWLALALGRGYRVAPAALDPNLLAVAPFDVLDPSLELWREGLGDVLSRTLDGAGPLRTVSQSAVLGGWRGRADRASAEGLGRRTGAGLVVYGTIVPRGGNSVSVRATVLERGRAENQTEVEVSGEAERLGVLADSLGIEILASLSRGRPIGSVRQVSMGSLSVEALKAFLQGEQFYRRGLWDSALTRYHLAIAADSTFALALRRMANVLGWNPPTAGRYRPGEEYSRRSVRYNHGLSPRESLLIVADSLNFAAGEATDPDELVAFEFRSTATLEEAARRYPEDPEVWYELGEARNHTPHPLKGTPAAMFEAFNRAIARDSGFGPAYEHMPGLAIELGRPDLAVKYADAYVSLDPTFRGAEESRLISHLLDPTQANQPETEQLLAEASVHTVFSAVFGGVDFWPDTGETAIRLARRISDRGRAVGGDAPWVLDTVMWPQYLAVTLAFRGHLREAYAADSALLLDPGLSPFSVFLDPFLDLSLLGIIPDSVARTAFARAFEPPASWSDPATPRHLQGLPWWLARRDTASLARFATRAAKREQDSISPVVILRNRLLGSTAGGFLALVKGDSSGALQRLESIPDTLCMGDAYGRQCFHLKLVLSRLLAAQGEYRRAYDLLDRWRWDAGAAPSFVLATLELARLAERLGDRDKAAASYRFVADAWRRADPELQPYVAEAREALGRLAGPD